MLKSGAHLSRRDCRAMYSLLRYSTCLMQVGQLTVANLKDIANCADLNTSVPGTVSSIITPVIRFLILRDEQEK